MSKEKKINIDKNRFKTPQGYFENISLNNLLLPNKNNFKTPLNYFETIKFDFSNQKIKSKRFLIKNIVYSGIAAIFIFGIVSNFYFTDSDNSLISLSQNIQNGLMKRKLKLILKF